MPVGIDTGFFFAIQEGLEEAMRVWREVPDLVTSSIVVFEIERNLLKGRLRIKGGAEKYIRDLEETVTVTPVTAAIARRAAKLAHGTGLHGSDALILACLLDAGCSTIYTKDQHIAAYRQNGVEVRLIP